MEGVDLLILKNSCAVPVGRVISEWMKKNGIDNDVAVNATISYPSCYIDECGVPHSGPLVVVDVDIADDDIEEDD